jgi:hypothetical protein
MNDLISFIKTDSTPTVVQLACIILAYYAGYKYTLVTRQSSNWYFMFVAMFSYAIGTLVKAWFAIVVN